MEAEWFVGGHRYWRFPRITSFRILYFFFTEAALGLARAIFIGVDTITFDIFTSSKTRRSLFGDYA